MGFQLTARDMKRMEGVHPDIVETVVEAAKTCPIPFMVVEGIRGRENCMVNYGKGRTAAQLKVHGIPAIYAKPNAAKVTWLKDPFNSMHCKKPDGFGHAIDLLPAPYDWKDTKPFDIMITYVLAAAEKLGHNITSGADWDKDGKRRERGETDSPHFERGK